ncbi:hypothetical protein SMACR_05508 [Sordaria macrospora]|uniref:WGS project CABT00000000 data, contig 2.26 n=2 Tax=Sordaria macrospora TaxID=5147 RepID=F7W3X8_SORMK|nr:uncharacterized protein SMAC_05508 [Sordaria macrospora k-hell]KAA8634264.1 hypothetical protein SMACR_05508 [Sordaria macrospora]WPJ59686.1 hypothetical protein SMAC4_05508 [Sordaria macrospora]CCC12331.1 unnamed protein product [Sordaria macrospora k-hell]
MARYPARAKQGNNSNVGNNNNGMPAPKNEAVPEPAKTRPSTTSIGITKEISKKADIIAAVRAAATPLPSWCVHCLTNGYNCVAPAAGSAATSCLACQYAQKSCKATPAWFFSCRPRARPVELPAARIMETAER